MKNLLISKLGAFFISFLVFRIAQIVATGEWMVSDSASSITSGLATVGLGSMLRGIFVLIGLALITEVIILLEIEK